MSFPSKILPLLALFLAACAEQRVTTKVPQTLEQRLDQKQGFKQDAEGNWVPVNDKRSALDGKVSSYFQEKDAKVRKDYKTGDFATESWNGSKDYKTRNYETKQDGQRFAKDSKFNGQNASESGSSNSREGTQNSYQTNNYATSGAREQNSKFATRNDAAVQNRRETFEQPDVMEWRAYREMSVEQSKSMLGR